MVPLSLPLRLPGMIFTMLVATVFARFLAIAMNFCNEFGVLNRALIDKIYINTADFEI